MLQYETSGAGVRYLEQTINDGIGMIEENKCQEKIMVKLSSKRLEQIDIQKRQEGLREMHEQ